VGGPIVHDKLFFFDSEWVRIALPIVTAATVSNAGISELTFAATTLGRDRFCTGSVYQPSPQSVPFYSENVSLYGNTSGTLWRCLGCPFDVGGVAPVIANDGNGCANRQSVSHSSDDHEQVQTLASITTSMRKTRPGFAFQTDTGLQAAYTDLSTLCSTLFLRNLCTRSRRDIRTSFRKIL